MSLFTLPGYFPEVADVFSAQDWIIHNFTTKSEDELYNPANYLQNIELEGFDYRAVVDLNILQFIVNCSKKLRPNQSYRAAAAFLSFCQVSKITVDPTYAIYERINYDGSRLEEALTDLELFRNIDNDDPENLAAYALSHSTSVEADNGIQIDKQYLRTALMQYNRLTEWDSLYLIVLAIVDVHLDQAIRRERKLSVFIEWLITEFRLSLPAIAYATRLFGQVPIRKMMKYRPSMQACRRRAAIFNMTWDLFLMNMFFRKWTSKEFGAEIFLVSDDRALKEVLRLAINVQNAGTTDAFRKSVGEHAWPAVRELLSTYRSRTDRVYGGNEWSADHRAELIQRLSRRLLT